MCIRDRVLMGGKGGSAWDVGRPRRGRSLRLTSLSPSRTRAAFWAVDALGYESLDAQDMRMRSCAIADRNRVRGRAPRIGLSGQGTEHTKALGYAGNRTDLGYDGVPALCAFSDGRAVAKEVPWGKVLAALIRAFSVRARLRRCTCYGFHCEAVAAGDRRIGCAVAARAFAIRVRVRRLSAECHGVRAARVGLL